MTYQQKSRKESGVGKKQYLQNENFRKLVRLKYRYFEERNNEIDTNDSKPTKKDKASSAINNFKEN